MLYWALPRTSGDEPYLRDGNVFVWFAFPALAGVSRSARLALLFPALAGLSRIEIAATLRPALAGMSRTARVAHYRPALAGMNYSEIAIISLQFAAPRKRGFLMPALRSESVVRGMLGERSAIVWCSRWLFGV